MAEFENIKNTDEWEVWTPDGWKEFSGVGKTVQYKEYKVTLEDDREIICADTHIFNINGYNIYCQDLNIGDTLDTIDGNKKVTNIENLDSWSNMYDLVDVDGRVYYTDGIASHNTTTVGAYILWYACFNNDKFIGITSNTASSAKDVLNRIKIMYEELPVWLKPGVLEYNKHSIVLDNGTTIMTAATSKDAFRGRTINCLYMDEMAAVDPSWKAEEFWAANYSTITASKHSKIIVTSTPKGLHNLFHRIYSGRNNFKTLCFPWYYHPERGEEWKEETKANMTNVEWQQEHECVGGDTLVNIKNSDSIRMDTLYSLISNSNIDTKIFKNNENIQILTPSGYKDFYGIRKQRKEAIRFHFFENIDSIDVTFNHIFLQNGKEIFSGDLNVGDFLDHQELNSVQIANIQNLGKIEVYDLVSVDGSIYYTNGLKSHNCRFLGSSHTLIDSSTLEFLLEHESDQYFRDLNDRFKIFEKPLEGYNYVLGVDVAKGTGRDYSVCQVLRVDSVDPVDVEQVAIFRNNTTDVYEFSEVIHKICKYYNDAFIMVENNGEGSTIVSNLWWDFENEMLVNSGSKKNNLGIRAHRNTKPTAVLLMKKLIENGNLRIKDSDTINELTGFIQDNNKFYGKDVHDDTIAALYWAVYIFEFDELTENYTFKRFENPEGDEGWGILSDVDDGVADIIEEEDFSWLL